MPRPYNFAIGQIVEVNGLRNRPQSALYEAIITDSPLLNLYVVEYFTLLMADKRTRLKEVVRRERVYPLRLNLTDSNFHFGTTVRAWRNGGWWECTVIRRWIAPIKYRVYFTETDDNIVVDASRVRASVS